MLTSFSVSSGYYPDLFRQAKYFLLPFDSFSPPCLLLSVTGKQALHSASERLVLEIVFITPRESCGDATCYPLALLNHHLVMLARACSLYVVCCLFYFFVSPVLLPYMYIIYYVQVTCNPFTREFQRNVRRKYYRNVPTVQFQYNFGHKKVARGRTPALATFNMEAYGFGTEPIHLDYITLLWFMTAG